MKIRLIRPWRNYKRGHVLDAPDGQANLMIERGFAAALEAEVETASFRGGVERATVGTVKQHKRRG